MKIKYEIYSRPGCHLCEEMFNQLGKVENISSDDINVLNIETNQNLLNKFHYRIPVLFVNGKEVCSGKLDRQALIEAILQVSSGHS